MLVSHRKRFIYTKTVKTAGTSVESYFEPYCMPEGEWEFSNAREEYVSPTGIIGYRGDDKDARKSAKWWNHMSAAAIRNQLGASVFDGYFKFCVIRNPFDKVVSAFHFFSAQSGQHASLLTLDRDSLKQQFELWVSNGKLAIDRNKYLIDNVISVDYFIRYESLHAGIEHVCNVLGIPFEPEKIPRLKSGIRAGAFSVADYYTPRSIEIVATAYEFELDHFGYMKPF